MTHGRACRLPLALLFLLALVFLAPAQTALPPQPVNAQSVEAITRPSEDVTLSFVRPGRIAQVLVKEGDSVPAGQLLVHQDDSAELLQLEQLEAEAKSDVHVRAAQAQLDEKTVEYEKMKDAGTKGAVSRWDVDRARLAVEIAKLSLELSRFDHSQAQRKYDQARADIDRMSLKSPIAGKVEKLFVQPGEAADALAKIVRVVKIDPLWIDVPVPLAAARNLKPGQAALVAFSQTDPAPARGKLTLVAAVADAASDTITCRVELPNPVARPAGEHVLVSFPSTAPEK